MYEALEKPLTRLCSLGYVRKRLFLVLFAEQTPLPFFDDGAVFGLFRFHTTYSWLNAAIGATTWSHRVKHWRC